MDVFLLGAGKPASGVKPSALKNIALNTRAMDWQIHSFESVAKPEDIHYLGGYYIDDVIASYPQLNFTVIPDWQKRSILHTFLKSPFTGNPVIVSYSDTVFRKEVVTEMLSIEADVVFCVDSYWKERYESRSSEDIRVAEKILLESDTGTSTEVEFTGLIHFNEKVATYLPQIKESEVGSTLIHLIDFLDKQGFSVKPFNVTGHWAEFNSPRDIAQFILGTKAETLARLEPLVRRSHIGKQVSFTSVKWQETPQDILDEISDSFAGSSIIVRSSAKGEDNWHSSNAGSYKSLLDIDVSDRNAISQAIGTVINSYETGQSHDDQILVQRFLHNVSISGVVFTCILETGAPYYRFNFDDKTSSTESVTSGTQGDLRTVIACRFSTQHLQEIEPELVPVWNAVRELEQLLGFDKLDVEFAVDDTGIVHIFQVRPVTVDHSMYEMEPESIAKSLNDCELRFREQQNPSPFIYGNKILFANMPDWNPAEIIGTRPKPLAFSLYRQLISNEIWALQRAEFGYRDVRPSPLIISFSGHPYVDVRASLNSFIPAGLPDEAAARLADAYIDILADNPHLHDKIEFDVAFTVWTPGFMETASARLMPYGVTREDIGKLETALKQITCHALTRLDDDIKTINRLNTRRCAVDSSNLSTIDKIFALLDDCKSYGTLAFSHAARAGFIATTFLKSFVVSGLISNEQRLSFLKSINTVMGEIEKDRHDCKNGLLSPQELVEKYGHLRPGTYEITAQAYWENPAHYLFSDNSNAVKEKPDFKFPASALSGMESILKELGASISAADLNYYLVKAIKSREFVKFEFTKNVSRVLDLCVEYGMEHSITREMLSYIEYYDLELLKLNAISIDQLKSQIEKRRRNYALTCTIELPSLISNTSDFYCFERFASQPNFVTVNRVEAPVHQLDSNSQNDIDGKVILIPQADPGYDWLFGHSISGLITQYGGANSHMAIRAAEIGLPAAIGVGEKLYEKISRMERVELDCAGQIIREVH